MAGEINWPLAISVALLAFTILTGVGGLVWKLSRIELGLRAEFNLDVTAIRADHTRELAALSAKLYQVEIWARDEFVRKGSFEIVIARMEKGFGDLRTEISGRLDKISEKVDGIKHAGGK